MQLDILTPSSAPCQNPHSSLSQLTTRRSPQRRRLDKMIYTSSTFQQLYSLRSKDVRIVCLLGLLFLSQSQALALPSFVDKSSADKQLGVTDNSGLSVHHTRFLENTRFLEKRVNEKVPWSEREQRLCCQIAERIDNLIEDGDVVYFIGNSGSYVHQIILHYELTY